MIETTIKCDVCGAVKGQTNHWFDLWRSDEGCIIVAPSKPDVTASQVCGKKCLHVLIDKLLEGK